MRQIIETTDGKFIGFTFDENEPLVLNGAEFVPDRITPLMDNIIRYSNSNYIIDVKELSNG